MTVLAMQVMTAKDHDNADTLRVYNLKANDHNISVVANLENVYQVGDIVAVALADTTLKDGTYVKKANLRGISSYGMTLGIVKAKVGDDLSSLYCVEQSATAPVVKWGSIEQLHNVRRQIKLEDESFEFQKVTYRAKVKLHGTNAGVQILPTGEVVAQSRSRVLKIGDDNAGFAAWVMQNYDYFAQLADSKKHYIIFGEWCGAGIQKGVAISEIGRKIFAIFAIQQGDHNKEPATLQVDPDEIRRFMPPNQDIFVLPWYGESRLLDFSKPDQLWERAEEINIDVNVVANQDPWVEKTFGVKGVGEGLVLYPSFPTNCHNPWVDRSWCKELMFKAKSEKHQVAKQKKPVMLDPAIATSIDEFVDNVVTSARLEQCVTEACEGSYEMRKVGDFIKWISLDVQKETDAELEASGLTWSQVQKKVVNKSRQWYIQNVKKLK